ncbi:hypothetical protein ACFTAO_00065 [Paenibacillus rhizoplanae]
MRHSFESGADVTAKLDSLSDQLAAAEKDFQRKDLALTMSAGAKSEDAGGRSYASLEYGVLAEIPRGSV